MDKGAARILTLGLLLTVSPLSFFGETGAALAQGAAPSTSDQQGIQASVSGAISKAIASLPPGSSQTAIDAAVASALASETQLLLSTYSSDNPTAVAEDIVAAASGDGASDSAVGSGMAQAALDENSQVGTDIANAVGSTATTTAVTAFEAVADAAGTTYGTTLAAAASSGSEIASGNGDHRSGGNGILFAGGGGAPGGAGGGGSGCLNPSCTH